MAAAQRLRVPQRADGGVDRPCKSSTNGPVVLADHGENAGAGGVSDDPTVLAEVLRQGLTDVMAGPYVDPATVAQMIAAGVANEVTIAVGGKTDMPAVDLTGSRCR